MKIQVLVATMNQHDHSLIERMNINSDAIIGNQGSFNKIEKFTCRENEIIYLNFAERGVGLNRNNALMRATGDIVMFADENVVYYDGYVEKIQKEYELHPEADIILFNFKCTRDGDNYYETVTKEGYVSRKGLASFETNSVTARLNRIKSKNVFFINFLAAELNTVMEKIRFFLKECKDKHLKIYATKTIIGEIVNLNSTWFNGYNDKYFFDTGALYKCMYPQTAAIIACYHAFRHKNLFMSYGIKKAILQMFRGIKEYI